MDESTETSSQPRVARMQQINLLNGELLPRTEHLFARQFVTSWGGFALLLAIISGWQGFSMHGLENDIAQTKTDVERLRAANAAALAKTVEPQDLRDQVTSLQRQQDEQGQLVELLNNQQRSPGFLQYLNGLGRARVDGLWLSQITISHVSGRRISLKGSAMDPGHVPRLLQNLASQSEFKGQRFDQLEVKADLDHRKVEFTISSPELGSPG
jgi:hypothetical protein